MVNAARAAEEVLRRSDPALYEQRKIEAYVFGEGEPNPAVVTFTTELACMAVDETIHRFQGFRGPDGAVTNLVRQFHRMTDFKPGSRLVPGCSLCDNEHYWGRGDMTPFLDRVA